MKCSTKTSLAIIAANKNPNKQDARVMQIITEKQQLYIAFSHR